MIKFLLFALLLLDAKPSSAIDVPLYNSLVQLETSDSVYNGVNIADGYILTVAHHGVGDYFIAVFHGENGERMKLRADVVKIDNSLDLCLLQYKIPEFIEGVVQKKTIRNKLVSRCDITGWTGNNVMFTFMNTELDKFMHVGYTTIELHGLGMFNGGELIGLQTYRNGPRIQWVTAEQILNFLQ